MTRTAGPLANPRPGRGASAALHKGSIAPLGLDSSIPSSGIQKNARVSYRYQTCVVESHRLGFFSMTNPLQTIVFTDLVKSTALKSLLPGEDLAARNQAYLATIEEPHRLRIMAGIEAADGRVVKSTGDGFFLIFADPIKAARWAVGVQQSHRSDPIATPLGPLDVKIGMHIGAPPPNPHDPTDYVGQEVDFAARLCDAASRGQVLISELIAALIRSACAADLSAHPHGLRELRGIGRTPIFELLGANQRPRPPAPAAFSPSNLPPPPIDFIGRADLLDEIRGCLREGGVTILKGEGGMGKTATALQVAHNARAAGELPGGVAWINSELVLSLDESLRQAAGVFFGDRMEQQTADECGRRVIEHLAHGDALVVFDNFETVAHDSQLICWLARVRPPTRILITTRELAPGLSGRVVAVPELCPDEAQRLFTERATRAGATMTAGEVAIEELCSAVGGQPLAIELLAARAAMVPLPRLIQRARKSLDVIAAASDPTRPDRHQSAQRCIELSVKELSSAARDLLRRICVFPAAVGPTVISAVVGGQDWDAGAEELVAASVWRLSADRYTMHPLVRQFAIQELAESRSEVERQAAQGLMRFVVSRAEQAPVRQDQPAAVKAAIDWCEAELRNLLAAADFAVAAEEWDSVIRFASALFGFFQIRGHWTDAEHLYTQSLSAARRAGPRSAEAHDLNRLGLIHRQLGRWALAEAAHRDSLVIWRELGDRRGEGNTLKHLAGMLQLRQSYDESAILCQQALERLREAEDKVGEAKTLIYLGNVHRLSGRDQAAVAVYEHALALSERIGDRYDEGAILRRLGQVFHQQGRGDEAKEAFARGLTIWRAFDDRHNEAVILDDLGALLRDQERWGEAEAMLKQSAIVFQKFGDRRKEGGSLLNLAKLHAARGEHETALDLGRQAARVLESTEDHWTLARAREFVHEQTQATSR